MGKVDTGQILVRERDQGRLSSFRMVHGWTHGYAAIICCIASRVLVAKSPSHRCRDLELAISGTCVIAYLQVSLQT